MNLVKAYLVETSTKAPDAAEDEDVRNGRDFGGSHDSLKKLAEGNDHGDLGRWHQVLEVDLDVPEGLGNVLVEQMLKLLLPLGVLLGLVPFWCLVPLYLLLVSVRLPLLLVGWLLVLLRAAAVACCCCRSSACLSVCLSFQTVSGLGMRRPPPPSLSPSPESAALTRGWRRRRKRRNAPAAPQGLTGSA